MSKELYSMCQKIMRGRIPRKEWIGNTRNIGNPEEINRVPNYLLKNSKKKEKRAISKQGIKDRNEKITTNTEKEKSVWEDYKVSCRMQTDMLNWNSWQKGTNATCKKKNQQQKYGMVENAINKS